MPTTMKPNTQRLHIPGAAFALTIAVAQLNAQTGSVDPTFAPGGGTASIQKIVLQHDGRILAAGSFSDYNGTVVAPPGLVRLNTNGLVDPTFHPNPGFVGQTLIIPGVFTNVSPATLNAVLETPAGILVGGTFESVNGSPHTNLVRLLADGSVDPGFSCNSDNSVLAAVPLSGNRYLVAGGFSKIHGSSRKLVAIINGDGSVDPSFNPNWGSLIPASAHTVAVQTDGKILVGGGMLVFSGGLVPKVVARLNTDGTLDPSFTPPTVSFTTEFVGNLVVQSTGKILATGGFSSVNGAAHKAIVRLNSDGSVDPSWLGPGIGNLGLESIDAMAAAAEGQIFIGGKFETYNGQSHPGIARLSADGTLDTTFQKPPGSTTFWVGSLAVQSDGNVLIGGTFTLGTTTDSTKILIRLSTQVIGPPPAPKIDQQPVDATVNLGSPADFTVQASGTPPLIYEWQFNSKKVEFQTSPTLHLAGVTSDNVGDFRVIVSNAGGSITSSVAKLNVILPARVAIPPPSQSVVVTGKASFDVTAAGTPPITYQWRKNGTNIVNATNRVFEIAVVSFTDAGGYSVAVANSAGGETSATAQLTVLEQPIKITASPLSQVVTLADTNITAALLAKHSLCLTVAGALPPWINSGNYCITFTSSNYSSPARGALTNTSAGTYSVGPGIAPPATLIHFDRFFPTGEAATLTLLSNGIYEFNRDALVADQNGHWALNPPFIPPAGPTITLSVKASGPANLQYQWRKDNKTVPGATNSTLTIGNFQRSDLGTYTVVVSTATQSVTSDPAILSENAVATGELGFTALGGNLTLTWGPADKLESTPTLSPAAWNAVVGATSPYSPPLSPGKGFFRVVPK